MLTYVEEIGWNSGGRMVQFLALWNGLSLARRIAVAVATAVMFAAVLGLARMASEPDMALLYSGLEPRAAAEMIAAIEGRGIPFSVEGGAIMVPREEGDAVSRFPDVGLGATPGPGGAVVFGSVCLDRFIVDVIGRLGVVQPAHERPVVAGHDHQSFLGDPGPVDRFQGSPQAGIDLSNEVAIGTQPRRPHERFGRQDGLMRSGQGKIEKTWLLVRGDRFDERDRFVGQPVQAAPHVEIVGARAFAGEPGKGGGRLADRFGGGCPSVAKVDVGRKIE